MPRSVLRGLPELNPPDIMPNGNVGTPTSVYGQLIKECRLPPWLIKYLGLVFPKSRSNKRYGNVELDYTTIEQEPTMEDEAPRQAKPKKKKKKKKKRKRKDRTPSPIETKRQKMRHESSNREQSLSPPKFDEVCTCIFYSLK